MHAILKNCLVLTALSIVPAYAQGVAGTAGQIQGINAPASVTRTGIQSDTLMMAFQERQRFVLIKPVSVNISVPGTYIVTKSDTPATLAAGTMVNSCMLESNPTSNRSTYYNASITFKSDVLGIIIGTRKLNKTDSQLGAPGTAYPVGDEARGLEQGKKRGIVTLSSDRRTVTIQCNTIGAEDQIRIITAAN